MPTRQIYIRLERPQRSYRVTVGSGLLKSAGRWAQTSLKRASGRIMIVTDPTVAELYGEAVERSLSEIGFSVSVFRIDEGEGNKTFRTAENAINALSNAGLTRTDAVVALGGGVVGDLAGFAAATYLRGISLLQIPTTLLAMVDSSVGGKTGVNTAHGKNLVGSFHQPRGVLVDVATLATLPDRELTAGMCEMIKHAVISGRPLFNRTVEFLDEFPPGSGTDHFASRQFHSRLGGLIGSSIHLKSTIVAGDEREAANRKDRRSRKVLNLGHTLAHALEKATDYSYFRHGEAVGYGLLFAAELSKYLAFCSQKVVNSLYDVVHRAGPLPPLAGIDPDEVLDAFRFDKKNLAGSLQMVLIRGIGRPVIVEAKDLPPAAIQSVLKELFQKWA